MTKRIVKISLITIFLIICMACFRFSYAAAWDDIFSGLAEGIVGLLALGLQQLAVLLFGAINLLTAGITGAATDGSGTVATMGDVVFNRCALTSANFFNEVWVGNIQYGTVMTGLVENISKYYVIVRNLSIAMLLGILLYVGIRMAISTVASDEAKYKKMLFDWAISLVLVFVLHFIIIITFYINNQLVDILAQFDPHSSWDMTALLGQAMVTGAGIDELIVYGAFSIANLAFVLTYIKRTIVLGFLIVISPLITITYAIDKMGDGKSQALNTWLREFVFTVIIQPFHCIIYIVFYGSTVKAVQGFGFNTERDLGLMIFAAASAFFMLKAEGIVKKIFGIQPSGIGDAIGTGAMALTAATGIFGKNKGKKIDQSKGKMPKMKNNIDKKDEKNGDNTDAVAEGNAKDGGVNSKGGQTGNTTGDASGNTSGNNNSDGSSSGDGTSSADVAAAASAATAASSANGNASGGTSAVGNESNKKSSSALEKLKKGGMLFLGGEKHFKRNGGLEGYMRRKISGAATLAGVIAGGSVGDIKTVVSVGTAAGSVASNTYDNLQYKITESKLEANQEAFAGAYKDFERAYRAEMEAKGEKVDDSKIMSAAKHIYDGGGQNLTSEYERDFYEQMDQLSTSAEIMGYKNGYDYIKDTMRSVQNDVVRPNSKYVPKYYNRKSDNGTTGNTSGNN